MNKDEAQRFLQKILGPTRQELHGKEKEQILLLMRLVQPFNETNNQHSWTSYYIIGQTEYHVTYFGNEDDPIVEKILIDDYK